MRPHALLDQVAPGGAVSGDVARRGDMIGRHGVTEKRQHARAVNIGRSARYLRQILEERGFWT